VAKEVRWNEFTTERRKDFGREGHTDFAARFVLFCWGNWFVEVLWGFRDLIYIFTQECCWVNDLIGGLRLERGWWYFETHLKLLTFFMRTHLKITSQSYSTNLFFLKFKAVIGLRLSLSTIAGYDSI